MNAPRLGKVLQRLSSFRPKQLSTRMTLLRPMKRLGRMAGLPELMIKRDDLQPTGMGGNKLRKLDYLLSDPAAVGADTLLTVGALQSNHARLTAAAAAELGLRCELLLIDRVRREHAAYQGNGNRILNSLLGARTQVLSPTEDMPAAIDQRCTELREAGHVPFVIPFGGSSWRGSLGYVDMVCELRQQLSHERVHIVCACGSAGMLAGIVAGVSALGLGWPVTGISVLASRDDIAPTVERLARETLAALGDADLPLTTWDVLDNWVGPGYGLPSDAMRAAVQLVSASEGVLLDPVYTGKAMAGLLELARKGARFEPDAPVVFVHSGGLPGLFAYPDVFEPTSEPSLLPLPVSTL
ncbi:MAG: D-cysteine desulfhydrase family protein [Burkholderiaceae bacterium]|jgi:D-cysteine desulfhydrase family pyridoxal phosphate-dependent enzyme|nr:D-cysteine desulfhydrase family protein [Burkholderiaceae bacterium]